MRKNSDIRNAIANARLHQWEVAEKLGVNEGTFCKWLRYELPEEKKARILSAIRELIHDTNN